MEPVALATSPSAPAETLLVAGYGRTSTEWVPQQLHGGTVSVAEVGALGFRILISLNGLALLVFGIAPQMLMGMCLEAVQRL